MPGVWCLDRRFEFRERSQHAAWTLRRVAHDVVPGHAEQETQRIDSTNVSQNLPLAFSPLRERGQR